jgi:hypothetical protein
VRFRCSACPNNCTPPGKLRGFKLRDHSCPCGGELRKGTNAGGAEVPAMPLKLQERAVADARLGMKRSTSRPRQRGAVRPELLPWITIGGPVLVIVIALIVAAVRKYRPWSLEGFKQRIICDDCHHEIRPGCEPTLHDVCLACRHVRRERAA